MTEPRDPFLSAPVRDTEVYAPTPETPDVLAEVSDERVRQVHRWGVQSLPSGAGRNGHRDADTAAMFRKVADRAAADGDLAWRDVLNEEVAEAYVETDPARLRSELVQVAAVAVAWIEDIDRTGATG